MGVGLAKIIWSPGPGAHFLIASHMIKVYMLRLPIPVLRPVRPAFVHKEVGEHKRFANVSCDNQDKCHPTYLNFASLRLS